MSLYNLSCRHSQKHIVLDIQRTRRLQSLDGSMRKVLGGVQVNGSTQHLLGDYCYDDERSVESEPSSQGVTMSTQVMPQLTLTYQVRSNLSFSPGNCHVKVDIRSTNHENSVYNFLIDILYPSSLNSHTFRIQFINFHQTNFD